MLARLFPKLKLPARTSSARLPITAPDLAGDPAAIHRAVWAFVWLGVAARAVRYLLCFPLWEDECFLCYNLIDRGYAELLQPLDYHQVAPLLFLWAQLTVVKLLGFSEWTLRLIPFVCGIASVFLFRHLAAKLLTGLPLLFAVAVFCVSYPGIRYAAEAKPYGTDLFVGLAMVAMFVAWRQSSRQSRWLWAMVATAPMVIGVSYPAVFVCGGISLVWGAAVVKSKLDLNARAKSAAEHEGSGKSREATATFVPWLCFSAAIVATFSGTYAIAVSNQSGAELSFMQQYWGSAFPPLDSLGSFLAWFGITHTSDLLAYPVGGARGASALTAICCVVGVLVLSRQRKWLLLALAAAPLALNFIAAALHRYPYGGHVKFAQYHAALICFVAGVGMAAVISRHAAWRPSRGVLGLRTAVGGLMLVAVASMARDVISPYKSTTDMRHRAFAQWFWFNTEFQGETACLESDLHKRFSSGTYDDLSWSAMYLCNQRIYSPRKIAGRPPEWEKISADWPLRCVLFRAPRFDFDEQAKADWLAEMKTQYRLTSVTTYPFPCFGKREREAINVDYVEVLTFVPHGPWGNQQIASHASPDSQSSKE